MSASVVIPLHESAPRFRFWPIAGFLALCYGAAWIGSALTTPGLAWMAALNKPFFQPPNWVFAPVWTLLYTLMALSGAFVYAAPKSKARSKALTLFAVQLILNVGWSALFFYARQPFWATVEIVFLLATIWAYVIVAKPASKTAAWLFIPYGLWVGFASVLTAGLWLLNR